MKKFVFLIFMISCNIMIAQSKEIPSCFQEKIDENPNYTALHLAEIEGEVLYFFSSPPKGADMIYVTIFYNENCEEVNRSYSGGYSGRPKGYKPFKVIETLWKNENHTSSLSIQEILKSSWIFEVTETFGEDKLFNFKTWDKIRISLKNGLQKLNSKQKAEKSFKITPITKINLKNAVYLEHDTFVWEFFQEKDNYFLLLKSPNDNNEKIGYQLKVFRK